MNAQGEASQHISGPSTVDKPRSHPGTWQIRAPLMRTADVLAGIAHLPITPAGAFCTRTSSTKVRDPLANGPTVPQKLCDLAHKSAQY